MFATHLVALAGVTAGLVSAFAPTSASAEAPQRFSQVEHVQESWGTCGPNDELMADYVISETGTIYSAGRGTLHLRVVGTITRSGTGAAGTFRNTQQDFVLDDGSERDLGLLGLFVVPGRGAYTLAGQVRVGSDGTVLTATPGTAALLEPDFDFAQVLCDALS
jgi:hypothetical protein